jgi:predicted acyltransferase
MYQKTWDPEGFFSTIPAIASGISGMFCGHVLLNQSKDLKDKIILIFVSGFSAMCLGMLWDYSFPMNKHIWTSSYVLFSSGLAMLFLATCIWIIDIKKKTSFFISELFLGLMQYLHMCYIQCFGGFSKSQFLMKKGFNKTGWILGFQLELIHS